MLLCVCVCVCMCVCVCVFVSVGDVCSGANRFENKKFKVKQSVLTWLMLQTYSLVIGILVTNKTGVLLSVFSVSPHSSTSLGEGITHFSPERLHISC